MNSKMLDTGTLESWLWEAACKIRGEIDAPKYKDFILPLIFLKRLSDVFEDEILRETGMMNREPFKGIARSSLQGAINRLTRNLAAKGVIRYKLFLS